MAMKQQPEEIRELYTRDKSAYMAAYTRANSDRIELRLPKGTKERWKALAKAQGVSLTEFIVRKVDGGVE